MIYGPEMSGTLEFTSPIPSRKGLKDIASFRPDRVVAFYFKNPQELALEETPVQVTPTWAQVHPIEDQELDAGETSSMGIRNMAPKWKLYIAEFHAGDVPIIPI